MNIVNFIDPTASIGARTSVWHFARVLAGASIGSDVSIGSGAEVGAHSTICAGTRIGAGTFLPPRSFIGPDVFIGPNVTFCDDRYPRCNNRSYHAEPPVVERNASIGAGAVVLPGVTIGAYSVIGAGAVVTKDVPPNSTFYGPAATQRTTPFEMVPVSQS